MPAEGYADLHVHISLKQIVNKLGDLWYSKRYSFLSDKPDRSEAGEYTQSDVTTMIIGKMDIAVAALYPLEDISDKYWVNRLVAKMVFGFDVPKIKRLRKKYPSKFELLNHEREYVEKGPFQRGRLKFDLVKTKSDLNSENTKVVFSMEGGHGLFGRNEDVNSQQFKTDIINNLIAVKNWEYPVFMLTLCHFQYNELAGQSWAVPLPGISKPAFKKVLPMLSSAGRESVNDLGKQVIETALDKSLGNRILIDLKHAAVESRIWYYDYIDNLSEHIPIIASHAGMSGIGTFDAQINDVDNRRANEANRKEDGNPVYRKFNPWGINLCDDDIRRIGSHGGIIGISLDQRILGSSNKSFKKHVKRNLRNAGLPDNKKNWHSALFLENVFHVVAIGASSTLWSMICVSSDNDGIIDPIDSCPTARHFREFERRLNHIAYAYYFESDYRDRIFVSSKNDLNRKLRKVFLDNLKNFITSYFPD